MNRLKSIVPVSGLALLLCGATLPAFAVPRTFVASNGLNTNPCSRTAPCHDFSAALAATDAGGEILVLDSSGYGTLNGNSAINKSVSIVAPTGIYAGVWVPANAIGVIVNSGANGTVYLKGLTITGSDTGTTGVSIQSGKSLVMENCRVSNFASRGIDFAAAGDLTLKNCSVRNVANSAVVALSASGFANLIMDRCDLQNSNIALYSSSNSRSVLRDCLIARNTYGLDVLSENANPAQMSATNCIIANNTIGIVAGNAGTARVANSTLTYNDTALLNWGGSLQTQRNNLIEGNGTEGAFNTALSGK